MNVNYSIRRLWFDAFGSLGEFSEPTTLETTFDLWSRTGTDQADTKNIMEKIELILQGKSANEVKWNPPILMEKSWRRA